MKDFATPFLKQAGMLDKVSTLFFFPYNPA